MTILAGDIGATHARLALFERRGARLVPIRRRNFKSREARGLEGLLSKFLGRGKAVPDAACFGVAGPVLDGRCETTNLPWIVDARRIARRLGLPSVSLLNDLQATANGVLHLGETRFARLQRGREQAAGHRAVIAAGTGLGEAALYWDGARHRPAASEGGHADFGPRNPLEARLLEYLAGRFGHVSYERIVSGPGLWNIYRFLRDTGVEPEPPGLAERLSAEDPAAVIVAGARGGKSGICSRALDLFASVYGAEAGNLALKTLATGGIYIGGGIAPRILDKLKDGTFMKAFVDKGRYAPLMRRIPVRVILEADAGLIGAARYALHDLMGE